MPLGPLGYPGWAPSTGGDAERAFCLSQRRFCFCKNANSQTKDLVQRAPSRSVESERPGIRSADLMLSSAIASTLEEIPANNLMQEALIIFSATIHLIRYLHWGLGLGLSVLVNPHHLILFLIVYILFSLSPFIVSPGHSFWCAITRFSFE